MADQQNREPLDQLAAAARNAGKLGKIAAAGARGGVQGAAAQAVKEYGHELAFFAAVVLCLPVLMLLLLPSVIFNGVMDSPDDPDSFILNNDVAVAENVIAIKDRIGAVLQQDYEDTLTAIETARASQTYSDVTDPVAGDVTFDTLSILSMYCAHTGAADYTQISIDDLEKQVKDHQGSYYSYTTSTETRTVTEEVPAEDGTTIEVESQQTFTVYTVAYAGEGYFANTVWALTDDEKSQASDYAANLTLYLYDLKGREGISILDELDAYLQAHPSTGVVSGEFGNPFNDPNWRTHISSPFGHRADVGLAGRDTTDHKGLDIAMPYGTPILAVQGGTVVTAKYGNSYGNYVVIDHGGGLSTLYAHCSQLLVSVGDVVSKYDTIAKVGSTGDSTGNHLHIGVIYNGDFVDPSPYLH